MIAFNAAITEERRGYLLEEKAEVESRLKEVGQSSIDSASVDPRLYLS